MGLEMLGRNLALWEGKVWVGGGRVRNGFYAEHCRESL
jgi:hypothetical protein